MKPLIIANWKCNPTTLQRAQRLFNSIENNLKKHSNILKNVGIIICPPFVYLPLFKNRKLEIKLGAQGLFYEEKGAFTGEISPLMLKNLGCQYVIIGHSERRALGETDEMINKKIKAAIKAKLKIIFCIGEKEKERKGGKTFKILKSQIDKGLKEISKKDFKNLILAYEPVWAIGSGKPCGIQEARKVYLFIKKLVKILMILYGGSVNSQNSSDYIKKAGFQGLLVGGASLNPQEFIKIVKNVSRD